MSHAIAYLGDYSLETCINEQDNSNYENGVMITIDTNTNTVDAANAIKFFEKFYNNAVHTFRQDLDLDHGTLDKNVLVIRQTNYNLTTYQWEVTGSHAVNALSYNETTEQFHVYDNQKKRYAFVDKIDVIVMFNK